MSEFEINFPRLTKYVLFHLSGDMLSKRQRVLAMEITGIALKKYTVNIDQKKQNNKAQISSPFLPLKELDSKGKLYQLSVFLDDKSCIVNYHNDLAKNDFLKEINSSSFNARELQIILFWKLTSIDGAYLQEFLTYIQTKYFLENPSTFYQQLESLLILFDKGLAKVKVKLIKKWIENNPKNIPPQLMQKEIDRSSIDQKGIVVNSMAFLLKQLGLKGNNSEIARVINLLLDLGEDPKKITSSSLYKMISDRQPKAWREKEETLIQHFKSHPDLSKHYYD